MSMKSITKAVRSALNAFISLGAVSAVAPAWAQELEPQDAHAEGDGQDILVTTRGCASADWGPNYMVLQGLRGHHRWTLLLAMTCLAEKAQNMTETFAQRPARPGH